MHDPNTRRGSLCGLTTLPLIGGGVTLIGQPTAAAAPIVTVASAEERLRRGLADVEAAFRDLFPGTGVVIRGNVLNGAHVSYGRMFQAEPDNRGLCACAMVLASPGYREEDARHV